MTLVLSVTCVGALIPSAGNVHLSRRALITAGAGGGGGDEFYKSFKNAGGGEALLAVIAGGLAWYGGQLRGSLFDEIAALEASGSINKQGAASHVPAVDLSPAGTPTAPAVKVELSAPGDDIAFVWLKDEETGEVLAARKGAAIAVPVGPGRRLVPFTSSAADGVWQGTPFAASVAK